MLRPFASFRERLLACRGEWFVIHWGVRDHARYGIEQTFQHADGRWYLAGRQLLDQFVRVLFVCRHNRIILHPAGRHTSRLPLREVRSREAGGEFHCAAHRIRPTIRLWRRRRSSNLRVLLPSSTRKTRKRWQPLMMAFGTRKLAEPSQPKKFASGCPSGLPPPLHAKGAERSCRNRRPHRRRRRGCSFPLWQFLVGSR